MDFEVQRFTRRCVVTERELAPGETFYSALIPAGSRVERHDYSSEAWQGPPDDALGWWKSQVPTAESKRPQWAPNDVMLDLFERLAELPESGDMRYVLALLLIRRRVLRLEDTDKNQAGHETLLLYCPRRETDSRVPVVMPDAARAVQIQQELAELLFRKAA